MNRVLLVLQVRLQLEDGASTASVEPKRAGYCEGASLGSVIITLAFNRLWEICFSK